MSGNDEESRVVRDEDADSRERAHENDDLPPQMFVPWERLSAQALRGVIEEFVTREGTEYGFSEVPLETKVAQVKRQLEREEVVLLFDAKTQTVNLVRADALRGKVSV
jgi:uncharacterized protein YheU (UPF0270 family)